MRHARRNGAAGSDDAAEQIVRRTAVLSETGSNAGVTRRDRPDQSKSRGAPKDPKAASAGKGELKERHAGAAERGVANT